MDFAKYLAADVLNVSGGLSVQVFGQATAIRIDLHSNHPLEVGDRVFIAEIRPGIWMSLGPIASSIDYFPFLVPPTPEEFDPLTITAGTVVQPEGDKINLNSGLQCPYSGPEPNPEERKVLVFVDEDDNCISLPDDPTVSTSGFFTGTVTGTPYIALASAPNNRITGAIVGDRIRANIDNLRNEGGNPFRTSSITWFVNGVQIDITSREFTLTAAHLGQVSFTFFAQLGNTTYTSSAAAITVSTAPDEPEVDNPTEGSISITGTTRPGDTVMADISGLSDPDGLSNPQPIFTRTYPGLIPGNAATLDIPPEATPGTIFSVAVTVEDDLENRSRPFTASAAVTSPADNNAIGVPVIQVIGEPSATTVQGGQRLQVDLSGISDADGLTNPGYTYNWLIEGSTLGTGSTYNVASGTRVGTVITVQVTFSDNLGNSYTRSSASITVTATANTPATGNPNIGGTLTEQGVATSNSGTIADEDGISGPSGGQFSIQWLLNGREVPGAVGTTFSIPDNTEGQRIQVRYSFIDSLGNVETRSSVVRSVAARENTPQGRIAVIPQDITASIQITATNPNEWTTTDIVTIRRRVGPRTSQIWPVPGTTIRFSDFVPPSPQTHPVSYTHLTLPTKA